MPELPEVETLANELNHSSLIGLKILDCKVFWSKTFQNHEGLLGQTFEKVYRRGKYLVFQLSKDFLLIHLRMTGRISLSTSETPLVHERVILKLSKGLFFHFQDQRKFGRFFLTSNLEEFFKHLGVEPLSKEFTVKKLKELSLKSKMKVKPFLLNQKYIAGLGNIYIDESLWDAKIAPQQPIHTLNDDEIKRLHHAIQKILKQGIAHQGTSLGEHGSNYGRLQGERGQNQFHLNVYGEEGKLCRRCQTPIAKIQFFQRGTHFCPTCQKVSPKKRSSSSRSSC